MPSGQISMVTTGRLSSLRPSIIGGGRPIKCLEACQWQNNLQVKYWGKISTSFHPRSLLNVIDDDTDRGSYLFLSNKRTNNTKKKIFQKYLLDPTNIIVHGQIVQYLWKIEIENRMLFGRSGVVPGGRSLCCWGLPSCSLLDAGTETQIQRGYLESRYLSQEGRCKDEQQTGQTQL